MGCFTFTYGDKPIEYRNECGFREIRRKCKIPYGGHAFLALPDGRFIEETDYDGYGRFGGVDCYEAVAELNKDVLISFFETRRENRKENRGEYDKTLFLIAEAYCKGTEDDALKVVMERSPDSLYMARDWKREIGICIACYLKDNRTLKYPLKFARTTKIPYEELEPTESCQ